MNKEDLLDRINFIGKIEIKKVIDDLIVEDALEVTMSDDIEITDDIFNELKKILIIFIESDDRLACKIQSSLDKHQDNDNVAATIGMSTVVISIALICGLLTASANELKAKHPELEFTDCVDILKALKLDKILVAIKNLVSDNEE